MNDSIFSAGSGQMFGLLTALAIATLVLAALWYRLNLQNRRLTSALFNTPQGLCMWDACASDPVQRPL